MAIPDDGLRGNNNENIDDLRADRTRAASTLNYGPQTRARRGAGAALSGTGAPQGDPRAYDRLSYQNYSTSAPIADPDYFDPRGREQIPGVPPSQPRQEATAGAAAAANGVNTTPGTPGLSSMQGRQTGAFSSVSPRPYFLIQPLDNRYDFLTGRKVYDASTGGGTGSLASSGRPSTQPTGTNTGASAAPNPGDDIVSYDEFGNPITRAEQEAAMGLDPFGGPGTTNPQAPTRNADGYLIPQDGETISAFQARLEADTPGVTYSDYLDADVDAFLEGSAERTWDAQTEQFVSPNPDADDPGNMQ